MRKGCPSRTELFKNIREDQGNQDDPNDYMETGLDAVFARNKFKELTRGVIFRELGRASGETLIANFSS